MRGREPYSRQARAFRIPLFAGLSLLTVLWTSCRPGAARMTDIDLTARRRQSRLVGIAGGVIALTAILYVVALYRL